jgi:cephalosporin hydroxylase
VRYRHRLHSTLNRIAGYLRPKPALIPTSATELLGTVRGREIAEQFNDLYYRSSRSMSYRGIPVLKNPCDLWVTMELLWTLRPAAIVETGTAHGGSATFYADIAKMFGLDCRVVTIDINPKWSYDPQSKGIVSLVGYSTDEKIAEQVRSAVHAAREHRDGAVLLMLDSEHSEANVLAELRLYAGLVTPGSYAIVEDSNINGHPSFPEHGPGPWEAVQKFLAEDPRFRADLECQRHLLTFNPHGWLRRVQ